MVDNNFISICGEKIDIIDAMLCEKLNITTASGKTINYLAAWWICLNIRADFVVSMMQRGWYAA